MEHGNSKKNEKEHHLYEIIDKHEGDTFKFGISDKPIEEDGLSNRVREQVHFLNLAVGWFRYIGKIIVFGIKNRLLAKEMEKSILTILMIFMENYREEILLEEILNLKKNEVCVLYL
jgi:hypothetical protein